MCVRIPQVADIETAVRLYYEKIEMGNSEIMELFPTASRSTAKKLKGLAREKMIEQDMPSFNPLSVNTRVAYVVWGLDIDDLERRLKKLRGLKLMKEGV